MTDEQDNTGQNKTKPNGKEGAVTAFPDAHDRDRLRRDKSAQERPPKEPILNLPRLVKIMIVILTLIHLALQFLPPGTERLVYFYLAFIPGMYQTPFDFPLQVLITPLTHALLHGGWLHLLINIGMLVAFGSAIEKHIGAKRFLLLFVLASFFGALTHLAFLWGSASPLIGASGGISGLFGGLLRLLQDRGHMNPGWRALMPITLLWVGISILYAMVASAPGDAGEIAWTAHIGGFLSGLLLFPWVQRQFRT